MFTELLGYTPYGYMVRINNRKMLFCTEYEALEYIKDV